MDTYKGKKLVKVTCQYCPAHACRGCHQRFLLQSYEDPHCMMCKRGWSSDFLAANFPLVFRNDTLRKHRRKVLFEREKTVLPAMQVYVGYKREELRFKKEAAELHQILGSIYGPDKDRVGTVSFQYLKAKDERAYCSVTHLHAKDGVARLKAQLAVSIFGSPEREALLKELEEARAERKKRKLAAAAAEAAFIPIDKQYREMFAQWNNLNREVYRNAALYEDRWVAGGGGAAAAAATERKEFIMKCPDEGCRGFLSSAYKCGTCSKWTCSACLLVLGAEKECGHVCNKDDVESAKTIKAETRPCPKCGTRIFKIDGCDQMFCTMEGCHTAFSWNTGHIVTGVIHNPHYYEWLRRAGGGAAPREAGDIPCGGLPGAWQMTTTLRNTDLTNLEVGRILEVHRHLRELIDFRLRDYPARAPANLNKDIDVKYLMNEIDEAEWKRQLEFNEAKFRRKREIGQVLQTAATAASDLLNQVVVRGAQFNGDHADQFTDWLRGTALTELRALHEFVNQSFKDLATREHMAVPQFGELWELKPIRALYRKAPAKKKGSAPATAAGGVADPAAGVGLIGPADEDDVVELLEEDEPAATANEIVEVRD